MRVLLALILLGASVTLIPSALSQSSVMIVEVEPNPAGPDAGNEWVVLFNPTSTIIDMTGWKIHAIHGSSNTYTIQDMIIGPCEKIRIVFPQQFIDNEGETLILQDGRGVTVDQVSDISDYGNDAATWSIADTPCDAVPLSWAEPATPVTPVTGEKHPGGLMTVVFIDLKTKGESILIMFPNNKTMLIDGGMPSSYAHLERTLKHHGVSEIDVMIGTHGDQDHIAGLTNVLDDPDFTTKRVLVSSVKSNTATYQNFVKKIEQGGLLQEVVFDGHRIHIDDTVRVSIVSPPHEEFEDGRNASSSNSNSLVTLIEYENVSFLFTADATHVTEAWLVKNHPVLDVDIINAPHHGSKYSSTDEFIEHVTPRLVVFSADLENEYGHPHQEAIDRYLIRGINYHQTGIEGNIVIQTDGTRCSLILRSGETPCYAGVQVVPEFMPVVAVLAASISATILLARRL